MCTDSVRIYGNSLHATGDPFCTVIGVGVVCVSRDRLGAVGGERRGRCVGPSAGGGSAAQRDEHGAVRRCCVNCLVSAAGIA